MDFVEMGGFFSGLALLQSLRQRRASQIGYRRVNGA
jgi:hypothetical protein